MGTLFHLIFQGTLGLLWWLILFPVIWLLAAPFILIIAIFQARPYQRAVWENFLTVHEFWKDNGDAFLP